MWIYSDDGKTVVDEEEVNAYTVDLYQEIALHYALTAHLKGGGSYKLYRVYYQRERIPEEEAIRACEEKLSYILKISKRVSSVEYL